MPSASEHKQKATDLLVNYLQAIATKAGMRWDPDYSAEVGQAVDEIVEAANGELRERLQRILALTTDFGQQIGELQVGVAGFLTRVNNLEQRLEQHEQGSTTHARAVEELRREGR